MAITPTFDHCRVTFLTLNSTDEEIRAAFSSGDHENFPEILGIFKGLWKESKDDPRIAGLVGEMDKLIAYCDARIEKGQPYRSICEMVTILQNPRTEKIPFFTAIAENLATARNDSQYENLVFNLNDVYAPFSNALRS